MLQEIRDKTQGWFATIIIGIVCLMFALWGINYYIQGSGSKNQDLAKVNGQSISLQQFNQEFQRVQQQQQMELGPDYSDAPEFQNNLKQQVLQQMIEQTLLVKELQKRGLSVSQSQVYAILMNMPTFQEMGKFSQQKLTQLLSRLGYTPQQFYQQLHDQLLVEQLAMGLSDTNFALPVDVNAAIRLIKETRDVGYMILPISHFMQPAKITDDMIKTYYQAHQDDFQSPEAVQLQYVILKPMGTDVQSQKQFTETAEQMANLAYENPNSLDSIVSKLHLLVQTTDYVTRDATNGKGILASPKIVAAAFNDDVLNQNYNSEILNLDDGSQVVIRLLHRRSAAALPLSKVKAQIVARLAKENAQKQIQQSAQALADKIGQNGNASVLAKSVQATWKEHPNVNRHQANVDPSVLQQVFDLPVPADRQHPTTAAITLPNGNVAVVAFYSVKYGDLAKATDEEKRIFSKQISLGYGKIDYTLYVDSLMSKAKVKLYNANSGDKE